MSERERERERERRTDSKFFEFGFGLNTMNEKKKDCMGDRKAMGEWFEEIERPKCPKLRNC